MYKLKFTKPADKTIKKWQRSNPNAYKKLSILLHELIDHPRTGTGHPEPLVGGHDITYSRRITAHDRLIYDIYENIVTILVVQVEEHYNDK